MSTRREVILSWLCEKRQTPRLCYLLVKWQLKNRQQLQKINTKKITLSPSKVSAQSARQRICY